MSELVERSTLAPAYLFRGPEADVWRKQQVLRRRFGQNACVRLRAASAAEVVDEARALSLAPERLLVVDGRAWKAEDCQVVADYLLAPTPGTTLAIHVKGAIPKALKHVRLYEYEDERPEHMPWDLTDAWGEGRRGRCLGVLAAMLEAGANPFALLGALAAHVRLVLTVEGYAARGLKARQVAELTGRKEFPIRKAHEHGRRRSPEELVQALQVLADADEAMKGGSRAPAEVELTLAVGRLFTNP